LKIRGLEPKEKKLRLNNQSTEGLSRKQLQKLAKIKQKMQREEGEDIGAEEEEEKAEEGGAVVRRPMVATEFDIYLSRQIAIERFVGSFTAQPSEKQPSRGGRGGGKRPQSSAESSEENLAQLAKHAFKSSGRFKQRLKHSVSTISNDSFIIEPMP